MSCSTLCTMGVCLRYTTSTSQVNLKALFPFENDMHPHFSRHFWEDLCPHAENLPLPVLYGKQKLALSVNKTSAFHHLLYCVLLQPNSQFNCSHLHHFFCFCCHDEHKLMICLWLIKMLPVNQAKQQVRLCCTGASIKIVYAHALV